MDESNYPIIMERESRRIDNSRAFALWFACLIFIPVFHTLSFGLLISHTNILNYIEVVSDEKIETPKKKNDIEKVEDEESDSEACSLTSSSDDDEYR